MLQVVSFDKANTVFTSGSAFHFNSALDHLMDEIACDVMLSIIVQQDRFPVLAERTRA